MPAADRNTTDRPRSLTLRDIYLDLPKSISKILVEAGITSLLNCIETQKKMILASHYLTSKLSFDLNQQESLNHPQNVAYDKLIGSINELFTQEYLKNEILHSEKNHKLFNKVVSSVENFDSNDRDMNKKLKTIAKFLKKGSKSGSSMVGNSKLINDTLSPSNDMNNFKDYYNLGDVDIIDEAEDIATHLMNEVIMTTLTFSRSQIAMLVACSWISITMITVDLWDFTKTGKEMETAASNCTIDF